MDVEYRKEDGVKEGDVGDRYFSTLQRSFYYRTRKSRVRSKYLFIHYQSITWDPITAYSLVQTAVLPSPEHCLRKSHPLPLYYRQLFADIKLIQ